jgi:biotin carboxyl carrier protein
VKISIGGREFEVTPGGDRIAVNGKEYAVAVRWDGGVPIVVVDGLPFRVELPEERGAEMTILVDHRPIEVKVSGAVRAATRRAAPKPKRAAAPTPTAGAVTASMTGEIVEVHVKPGDQVAAGAVLAILEAMKMRNEVRAPAAGVVAEVPVTPGTRVSQGDILVVLKEQAG